MKGLKQDSKLTWNQFCAEFGIKNQSAINLKAKELLKISDIPHTLSRDSETGIDYAHYTGPTLYRSKPKNSTPDISSDSNIRLDSSSHIEQNTESGFEESDMRREILRVLVRPMPMPEFNTKLMKSLHENGYQGYTAKSFVQACGVPKSWTMHRVLSIYLPGSVRIDGSATTGIVIPLSSKLNIEPEIGISQAPEDFEEPPSSTKFPKLPDLTHQKVCNFRENHRIQQKSSFICIIQLI